MILSRREGMLRAIAVGAMSAMLACADSTPRTGAADSLSVRAPEGELYKVSSDSTILRAARALMLSDSNVAVVTVDSMGQPERRLAPAQEIGAAR